jgi:beta-aspartyl-dipeptidase (metallo-type)
LGGIVFKLLRRGHCYNPEDIGVKDVFIIYDRIHRIEEEYSGWLPEETEVFDCSGKIVCPGFIDQHVHIVGGGGEQGPESRVPELMMGDIVCAGVTTVAGLLGMNAVTRSLADLYAKARALQCEGMNTYIYTGNYSVPPKTLTGRVTRDIVFIDKVLGAGEIAISDYRSSYPSLDQMKALASEVMIGGMLGKKAGVMHLHVGDGKEGLLPLFRLIEDTDFPAGMFIPTHVNRNKPVFVQAIEFAGKGGKIDLTAGDTGGKGCSVPDALKLLMECGVNIESITISSDGNGSAPGTGGGTGKVSRLYTDVIECITGRNITLSTVLKTVTSNAAKILKLYPRKGAIANGSDADILVLNSDDYSIDKVFINGHVLMDGGKLLKKGRYED